MITTKEEVITPKEAQLILDEHCVRVAEGKFRQRRISDQTVRRYAADMRVGNWQLSPQPIVFDVNDNLVDGQHRLAAIVKCGLDVKMMVSRGWPAPTKANGFEQIGTIDVVDRGRVRGNGQQLQLHGIASGNVISASVTAIVYTAMSGCKNAHPGVSYAMMCYVLDKLDMKRHIDTMFGMAVRNTGIGRTIGPLAYYHSVRPTKAKEFAERVFNLDVERGTGPQVYAKFMRDKNPSRQVDAIAALAACIRAWDDNESISYIRLNTSATQWLASLNPKLRDNIRQMINGNEAQ